MVFNPVSTYRIQFSKNFTFTDLKKVIPYLSKLGIRTIYASPVFRAVPGSEHGYDITSPLALNPEIGTVDQFAEIGMILTESGMGWIQDIVPNHMAYSIHNPWIADILEKGVKSQYSEFYDIDWNHPDNNLNRKLMLPFLGRSFTETIAAGELTVAWNGNRFVLKYSENEYPLNFASYLAILDKSAKGMLPDGLIRPVSIFNQALDHPEAGDEGRKILSDVYLRDQSVRDYVDKSLKTMNRSAELLIELVKIQYYLPVYWKYSEQVLNYRRFFTINEMICLRMEQEHVFDAYHSFIGELCKNNLVQGLRVDHIDGLHDPGTYLERLRYLAGKDKHIVVEKILEKDEHLERSWPVNGETGYHFLALANNLFTNEKTRQAFEKSYRLWNNDQSGNFNEVMYQKKQFILYHRMAGDLDNLCRFFMDLDLAGSKLFTSHKIKEAIGEFLLNCPVYRIYNAPGSFTSRQKAGIIRIFDQAMVKTPGLIHELLMLKTVFLQSKNNSKDKIKEAASFFRRCMQYTGPLMAKGGEDTAFYTFNRFIAHNEVGDSPSYFGISGEDFHDEMSWQQNHYPLSLNTTSTHDTKRGEDARARLAVLSDMHKSWIEHVQSWRILNRKFKTFDSKNEIPAPNDEYLIYQTIAGFIPMDLASGTDFEERLVRYITKALREGKVETSWSEPDRLYETNTHLFIRSILAEGTAFRNSLHSFLRKTAYPGIVNSLSQTLLKYTVPGVPDLYQGCEDWNFSFVDPDNRRPVRFGKLQERLTGIIKSNSEKGIDWNDLNDNDLKLGLTYLLLKCRNNYPELFLNGEYIPLEINGKLRNLAIAYARRYRGTIFIMAMSLHTGILYDNNMNAGLDKINWDDTHIILPEFWNTGYENLLNGKLLKSKKRIYLSELFSEAPVGFMKAQEKISGRKAGILMHITSLPGKYAIGDLGPGAYRFADFLRRNGQTYWQMLPVNPIYKRGGYSPYSSISAFAGNIFLISPELLAEQNMIGELPESLIAHTSSKVNYEQAEQIREIVLNEAYAKFRDRPFNVPENEFEDFCRKESYWLYDYALFIVLKKKHGFAAWNEWPKKFCDRDEKTLKQFTLENEYHIEREKFAQYLFNAQWNALKKYCCEREIKIFGDIPMYVNYDSADVWSFPEIFNLKRNKEIKAMAGVPPDYFSKTGQLWRMPVFRWDVMKRDGYDWWVKRIARNLEIFDILRLDHFRGFSAYWEVTAGEDTAMNGRWVRGPGKDLFDILKKNFPDMPFVAEDLGDIDKPVYALRDRYHLPGMRVLQFAFDSGNGRSLHMPHNHIENCIVYTGTHDNNTVKGWYTHEAGRKQRKNLKKYAGRKVTAKNCHLQVIRLAYSSVSKLVIIPLQDFLGLGENARMNIPSTENGNWTWRLTEKKLLRKIGKKIRHLLKIYGRI